jgi:hypothetical protein
MATHSRLRSSRVALSAAFLGLAATGTGGCSLPGPFSSGASDDEVAYCTDANEVIVDDDNCDGRSGNYYVRHGRSYPRGLRVGTKVPAGGLAFLAGDAAARSKFSLGSSFSNGSTIRSGTVGTSGGDGSGS